VEHETSYSKIIQKFLNCLYREYSSRKIHISLMTYEDLKSRENRDNLRTRNFQRQQGSSFCFSHLRNFAILREILMNSDTDRNLRKHIVDTYDINDIIQITLRVHQAISCAYVCARVNYLLLRVSGRPLFFREKIFMGNHDVYELFCASFLFIIVLCRVFCLPARVHSHLLHAEAIWRD